VRALALLGDKDFVDLSPSALKAICPRESFDTQEMLNAQASAADAYAERREAEAAEPFFASARPWMLDEARAHRELASYTRTLSPILYPYLVKAQGYFEGTGGFIVTLKARRLSVSHGSLGRVTPPIHEIPVVVFVERQIDAVAISAGIAE